MNNDREEHEIKIVPLLAEPFCIVNDVLEEDERKTLIDKVRVFSKNWEGDGSKAWISGEKSPNNSFGLNKEFFSVDEFRHLAKISENFVNEINQSLNSSIDKWTIAEGWYNLYTKHNYQEYHVHPSFGWSAIYFCKIPEGSSPIIFTDFNKQYISYTSGCVDTFKNVIDMKFPENSMVLFRSNIPHKVPFGNNDEERITLSFNFKVGD